MGTAMKKIALVLILPLVLGGCSLSLVKQSLPQIRYEQNNRNFDFEVDQQFQIVLAADRTTGYQWEIEDITEGVLELVDSKYQLSREDKEGVVGAGGEEILTFKVLQVERSHIVLEYRRPWDELDVTKKLLVTINGNPGDDGLLTFIGTIYSTPAGAQYDDYFKDQSGDEFGIEPFEVGKIADPGIKAGIAKFKDTGTLVEARGTMLEDIADYGGKQLIVHEIQAE